MTPSRTLSTLVALAAGVSLSAAQVPAPPNILLVLADDMGAMDMSCAGSDFYETPNLDRLAAQGVRFTSAYSACANCTPSRACLLSGMYVPRHGVYTVGGRDRFRWQDFPLVPPENADGLQPGTATIASLLGSGGYATTQLGKWHVLRDGLYKAERRPELYGFQSAEVLTTAKHIGFRMRPEDPTPTAAYLSDHLAERAIAAIDRSGGRPFFIYLADFVVHVPYQPPPELIGKYEAKATGRIHRHAAYAAMMERLDANVGRVLAHLDQRGLSGNTLVVFTSDNGAVLESPQPPFRGYKGMLAEGGIRVPLIARWPGRIPAGSTSEVPISGIDLLPTICAAAGVVPPADERVDGEDMLPVMSGAARARSTDLFWYMPGYLPGRQEPAAVIRSGDWKLLHDFTSDRIELYDLARDPGERSDLAGSQPARAQELKQRLDAWRQATGAAIPPRNPHPGAGAGSAPARGGGQGD